MWGVYPEARDWNVGALCLDFKVGERILIKSPRNNQIWYFEKKGQIRCLGAFSLTKIKI